jgi:hypothetical protein
VAQSQVKQVRTGLLRSRAQDVMQSMSIGKWFAITVKNIDDDAARPRVAAGDAVAARYFFPNGCKPFND